MELPNGYCSAIFVEKYEEPSHRLYNHNGHKLEIVRPKIQTTFKEKPSN